MGFDLYDIRSRSEDDPSRVLGMSMLNCSGGSTTELSIQVKW